MTQDSITELEKLRHEAEQLKRGESAPTAAATVAIVPEGCASFPDQAEVAEDGADLNDQIEALVEALKEELEHTSPMTLLVVFALGIVVGRFLPR